MLDISLGQYTSFDIFWYLVIFSILGWLLEVAFRYVKDREFVNRGFLHGPVCPIYGFGVSIVFIATSFLGLTNINYTLSNILLLFGVIVVLTTALELVVGYSLMLFFGQRWWDYSDLKYNIGGYISLIFSLAWGVGGSLLYLVMDFFELNRGINLPRPLFDYLGGVVLVYFVIDFTRSIDLGLRLKNFTKDLSEAGQQLKARLEHANTELDLIKVQSSIQSGELDQLISEHSEELSQERIESRLMLNEYINKYRDLLDENRVRPFKHFLNAYPNLRNLEDESLFHIIRNRLDLPTVKISLSKRERNDILTGNINLAKQVEIYDNFKNARSLQVLTTREAWPHLSMKTYQLHQDGFIEVGGTSLSHLYLVISGRCIVTSEKEEHTLNEKDYIYLPSEIDHTLSNKGDESVTIIDIIPNHKV